MTVWIYDNSDFYRQEMITRRRFLKNRKYMCKVKTYKCRFSAKPFLCRPTPRVFVSENMDSPACVGKFPLKYVHNTYVSDQASHCFVLICARLVNVNLLPHTVGGTHLCMFSNTYRRCSDMSNSNEKFKDFTRNDMMLLDKTMCAQHTQELSEPLTD